MAITNAKLQFGFIHHIFIFMWTSFHFAAVLGSSARYCSYGDDVSSWEALMNQTCETGDIHLAQTQIATDYDDTREPMKLYPKREPVLSSPDGGNCFIFRHHNTYYLPSGVKKETIGVSFGCDYHTVCIGKEADTVLDNVAFKGRLGQLYCCSSDNCNHLDRMPHTPAENHICYNGSNNDSRVGIESCNHPDHVFCIKLTQFTPNGKHETYSCDKRDNHRQCDLSSINGAYRFCDNRTVNGTVQELCCCDGNLCNKPSDPRLLLPPDNELTDQSTPAGQRKKITPIKNPQGSGKKSNNKVITGLVAALVVLVVSGIAIILFTAYKKGKQRSAMRRDPNVIMQYERLSASEPDLEDAVVV